MLISICFFSLHDLFQVSLFCFCLNLFVLDPTFRVRLFLLRVVILQHLLLVLCGGLTTGKHRARPGSAGEAAWACRLVGNTFALGLLRCPGNCFLICYPEDDV